MQSIKRMVRNAQNPIAQVTKRIVEKEQAKPIQTLSHKRYYVSAKTRDSCFILEDEIAFVREKRADGKLVADFVTLEDANDLFEKHASPRSSILPMWTDEWIKHIGGWWIREK